MLTRFKCLLLQPKKLTNQRNPLVMMQWNRATYFVAQNKAYRELVKQRLTKIPNTKLETIPCSESVLGKERE